MNIKKTALAILICCTLLTAIVAAVLLREKLIEITGEVLPTPATSVLEIYDANKTQSIIGIALGQIYRTTPYQTELWIQANNPNGPTFLSWNHTANVTEFQITMQFFNETTSTWLPWNSDESINRTGLEWTNIRVTITATVYAPNGPFKWYINFYLGDSADGFSVKSLYEPSGDRWWNNA